MPESASDAFQAVLLARLSLPRAVGEALAASLAAGRAPDAGTVQVPGWRLRPDAAGGWLLLEEVPAAPRPWAAGDRWGALHLAAAWNGDGLREAWLRLPGDDWLALQPRAGTHPLWGLSDALALHAQPGPAAPEPAAGTPVGLLPAQDYAALDALPPFDRPAALPPGAGGAVLNLLALLCTLQRRERIGYRGPYPTPALFGTLCRSFVPEGDPGQAQALFTRDETALAFRGVPAENPVSWRPAPFLAAQPAPGLLLHLRTGVETAWVGRVPFRRVHGSGTQGAGLPAGERVWTEASGEGDAVGLVLLGRPYVRFYRLAPDGAVRQAAAPDLPDAAWHGDADSGPPLEARWREALGAWVTLRAHPALAPAVAAQAAAMPAVWQALPLQLAALQGDALYLQTALAAEFRRRRVDEDSGALAMMLVSDVLEAATPHLLRAAQRHLEAERLEQASHGQAPQDAVTLLAAGEASQQEAKARLERALPALVQALVAGEALPEV